MNRLRKTSSKWTPPTFRSGFGGFLWAMPWALLPLACARPEAGSEPAADHGAQVLSLESSEMPPVADDPSSRIEPLLSWSQEDGPREKLSSRSTWGFRLNLAVPERADWTATVRGSVFCGHRLTRTASLALGIDAGNEADPGASVDLFVTRVHLGLSGRLGRDGNAWVRPSYRVALAYESADVEGDGAAFDRYATLGSVGLAVAPPEGRWQLSLEYLMMAGSAWESEFLAGISVCF